VCPDFDPDQANAYIERSLTSAVRLQYETHLSVCAACRKSVVALSRMAEADSLTIVNPARQVPQPTWLSRVREMFGAMSQPQWAMAATAVIVLAVSMPLFLSRDQARNASQTVTNQSTSDKPASAGSPSSTSGSGEAPSGVVATSKQRENGDDNSEVVAKNTPAPSITPDAAAGFATGVEFSKKAEARNEAEPLGEVQRKSESQVAPAQGQAGAAPAPQLARNDADQNRQQQPGKDSTAQQPGESKLAARVDEERAKEKTERDGVVAAPPTPPASSEAARGRSSMKRPGSLALRDSDTAEAARPEERKFSGKKFLFRDGAWTDKDFNPNKDLPVVTIIRDSNVYKEVLSKRPGLKPFLTGFAATERAIIVYKGTVYKLIPQ
jgi:hypothetical protein